MSRTRKDRPYWVRANDVTEDRIPYHFHRASYQSTLLIPACTEGCTLETSTNNRRTEWRHDNDPCHYMLNVSRNAQNTPDRATRRSQYHRPNRQSVRIYAQQAREAYNAQAEWDDEGVPERTNPDMLSYWNW